MPRGGLSQDPEKRKAQLARLEAGRKIARARREAGLPTKRGESRGSADDSRQSSSASGPAKVRRGTYSQGGSNRGDQPTPTPDPAEEDGGGGDDAPQLGRITRTYARILGYDVD